MYPWTTQFKAPIIKFFLDKILLEQYLHQIHFIITITTLEGATTLSTMTITIMTFRVIENKMRHSAWWQGIVMLSVTYAECHLCWVSLMLSVTYADCHLCWVSLMQRVTIKPIWCLLRNKNYSLFGQRVSDKVLSECSLLKSYHQI
jgi:hypothetical protein